VQMMSQSTEINPEILEESKVSKTDPNI
jgi:hypothetical protein